MSAILINIPEVPDDVRDSADEALITFANPYKGQLSVDIRLRNLTLSGSASHTLWVVLTFCTIPGGFTEKLFSQ